MASALFFSVIHVFPQVKDMIPQAVAWSPVTQRVMAFQVLARTITDSKCEVLLGCRAFLPADIADVVCVRVHLEGTLLAWMQNKRV